MCRDARSNTRTFAAVDLHLRLNGFMHNGTPAEAIAFVDPIFKEPAVDAATIAAFLRAHTSDP